MPKSVKKQNKYLEIFKESIVSSAGSALGILPQLIIGMLLIIPGIYLFSEEYKRVQAIKKSKDNKNENVSYNSKFYIGMVLIALGGILCLSILPGILVFALDAFVNSE
jgi:uncharacterized membrane protein YidH (DUF202 family)